MTLTMVTPDTLTNANVGNDKMSATSSIRATSNTPPSSITEAARDEVDPVAVIGFSFKFPQEATTAESFWEMLDDGRCAMTEFPSDRLSIDSFYHPDNNRRGTVRVIINATITVDFDTLGRFHHEAATSSRKTCGL